MLRGAGGSWEEESGLWDWVTDQAYSIGNAVYDAGGNFVEWVDDTVTGAQQAIVAGVQGELGRLRDAGAQFMAAYHAFNAIGPEVQSTPYAAEWLAIKGRADMARNTLDSIAGTAQSVYGFAKSAFGLSGVRDYVQRLQGVGAIPVLTVALVSGAVILVAGLANEMSQFVMNYNLVKQGRAPLPTTMGTGVFATTTNTMKWLAIGGAVLVLAPHVIDAFKKRGA